MYKKTFMFMFFFYYRVCRKWCALTKSPVLWKNVDVKFSFSDTSQTAIAKSLINQLPTCVTSIRLDFTEFSAHYCTVSKSDFEELCKKLLEKCPHLESLMLTNCEILDRLSSVINLCNQFLQNIKNLVFHHCIFRLHKFPRSNQKIQFRQENQVLPASYEFGCSLKFEVFDLNYSVFEHFDMPHFSRMPSLKVLCLSDTYVKDYSFEDTSFLNQLHVLNVGFTCINSMTFQTICIHGYNLKELYVCGVSLKDDDLNFNSSAFPYLKTICLSGPCVSCECIVSIIKSCPSLQNIYVSQYVATCFAEHPFVAANRDKLGIVKAIDWFHIHKVDYLHN